MGKKMGTAFITFTVIFVGVILGNFTLYYKYAYNPMKNISFKERTENIVNPDRGFYVQLNTKEVDRLAELKSEHINIVLAAYDIKEFLKTPLDNNKILELDTFLKKASELEIQIIFRAAYDFYGDYKEPDSMDTILFHINQICSVLNQYKENILSVQAGFLGPWGEWHSSIYLEGEKGVKNRNKVIEMLLKNLEKEIIINVRRPQFIREAKNAGMNTDRIGIHNDAFLSTEDDMGTYSDPDYDRETELEWMQEWITTGVNGGEMPSVSKYNNSYNAVKEMIKMKTSYLNGKYNVEVLSKWKKEEYKGVNSLEYIKGHLGYRLFMKKVSVSKRLRNGRKFILEGILQNSGFAPIKGDYELFAVVKKGDQRIETPIDSLILSSLEHGQNDKFRFEMELPKDFVTEEEVKIGLCIKKKANVKTNFECSSVELANDLIDYEENVNYFVKYQKIDKKNYTSKKHKPLKEKVISFFENIASDPIYYELEN